MDLKNAIVGKRKAMFAVIVGIVLVALAVYVFLPKSNAAQLSVTFQQAIGNRAPDFSMQGLNGTTVKLSDYRGKNVLLFFSEGGMCYPACWDQMASLATDPRFNNNNTVVFPIVLDQRMDWVGILNNVSGLAKINLTGLEKAKILFDTDRSAANAYGVLNLPSSMHPGIEPGHTYFLIDKNGIIRYALDDPQMGINNDKVAVALSSLNA